MCRFFWISRGGDCGGGGYTPSAPLKFLKEP